MNQLLQQKQYFILQSIESKKYLETQTSDYLIALKSLTDKFITIYNNEYLKLSNQYQSCLVEEEKRYHSLLESNTKITNEIDNQPFSQSILDSYQDLHNSLQQLVFLLLFFWSVDKTTKRNEANKLFFKNWASFTKTWIRNEWIISQITVKYSFSSSYTYNSWSSIFIINRITTSRRTEEANRNQRKRISIYISIHISVHYWFLYGFYQYDSESIQSAQSECIF